MAYALQRRAVEDLRVAPRRIVVRLRAEGPRKCVEAVESDNAAGEQRIGGRAGGATLAGEQFDHRLGPRPRGLGGSRQRQGGECGKDEDSAGKGSLRHGQGCKPGRRALASQKRVTGADSVHAAALSPFGTDLSPAKKHMAAPGDRHEIVTTVNGE